MTDRHISLDAAISVVMEYFPGNTINDPKFAAGKSLVEALSALPVVGGWLDIESAPRDGTPLDLWIIFTDGGYRWPSARWMLAGEHSCTGPANWCSHEKFPLHAFTEKPIATHWQPLPAPPEIE